MNVAASISPKSNLSLAGHRTLVENSEYAGGLGTRLTAPESRLRFASATTGAAGTSVRTGISFATVEIWSWNFFCRKYRMNSLAGSGFRAFFGIPKPYVATLSVGWRPSIEGNGNERYSNPSLA